MGLSMLIYQDDEFDDHVLVIETSLSYNKEGFVSE